MENSDLEIDRRFPILLKDDHFLQLQVKKSHNLIWHGRVKSTLNKLRERFWIVRGRQVLSRMIGRCIVCKRHLSKGLLPPPTPLCLPTDTEWLPIFASKLPERILLDRCM